MRKIGKFFKYRKITSGPDKPLERPRDDAAKIRSHCRLQRQTNMAARENAPKGDIIMAYTVGLIGIGAMGQALLTRLKLAGHNVQGFDISADSRSVAEKLGAALRGSAAEAARDARYVHVFVNSDEQMIDAALAANGVVGAMTADAILILHSTVLPETTRRIAAEATKRGIRTIDAPITSVPQRVRDGHTAFLVGGPAELVAEVRPYLESLGGHIYYFGAGTGNIAKLAKNFSDNTASRVLLSETVQMAEAGGIAPQAFFEMMGSRRTRLAGLSMAQAVRGRDRTCGAEAGTQSLQQGCPAGGRVREAPPGLDAPMAQGWTHGAGLDRALGHESRRAVALKSKRQNAFPSQVLTNCLAQERARQVRTIRTGVLKLASPTGFEPVSPP